MDKQAWKVSEKDYPSAGSRKEQLTFLVRYAILAPSSHNTQPWAFRVGKDRVDVYRDDNRWLRVADPDQRELHVSAGAALENLLIAAGHFGFGGEVEYFPEKDDSRLVARVRFFPGKKTLSVEEEELFRAIPDRHTNRREYDGRSLAYDVVERLEGVSQEEDVRVHITHDTDVRRWVDDLVVRADAIQFADPEWREELGLWLGRGVFGSGLIMSKVSQLAVTYLNIGKSTARKDEELLRSASALGVISAAEPDRLIQVKAGRVFERLFLTATSLGIAIQPMNQVLQVPDIRVGFKSLLPEEWGEPQMAFRLGYAEADEHTPRRPLGDVLRS